MVRWSLAIGITFAVARAFPLITGGALFAVGLLGVIVMVDGPALTVPQQITYRATHGGSTYWAMQENGTNDSGFLDMPSYGNKKPDARRSSRRPLNPNFSETSAIYKVASPGGGWPRWLA